MDERDIEAWARVHEFTALSAEQQWQVLAALGSREVYDRMRQVLLAAGPALAAESAALLPDPASAARLHAALGRRHGAARHARPSPWRRLTSYRIPVYQSVLGATALAGLVLFLALPQRRGPGTERIIERIVQVPTRDTVRIQGVDEATLQRITDSVHREVVATLAAEHRAEARRAAVAEQHGKEEQRAPEPSNDAGNDRSITSMQSEPNKFVGLANLPGLDQQKRGKSLSEDSAFRRFGVMVSTDR